MVSGAAALKGLMTHFETGVIFFSLAGESVCSFD